MANQFKIYYDNEKIFPDDFPGLDAPPARGVQIVLNNDDKEGLFFQSGHDYYWLTKEGLWRGGDIFGLFDFLLDSGFVIFGRTIPNKQFDKIFKKAKANPDIPLRARLLTRGSRRPW